MRRQVSHCEASNISSCGTRQETRQYCNKHYDQVRKHGKPMITRFDRRPAVIKGNMAKIPLGINAKDGYALVSTEDAWIDKYNWSLATIGYVQARVNGQYVLMHQLLLGKKAGKEIDHINIDRLDNRRSNLRHVTHNQNMYNLPIAQNNTSGVRGVSKDKRRNKWYAQIQKSGKHIFLGYFKTIEEAQGARLRAEQTLFKQI